MKVYNQLISRETSLAVIGLGYVGMPLAVAFAEKADVIGFDLNKVKIEQYMNGVDSTKEVGNDRISNTDVHFTSEEKDIQKAKFFIVAVPTPINQDKTPDLSPVIGATEIIGRNIRKGAIVVYESTVYPGVTEDICIPILEEKSGLICGRDFFIGYSPERINPGDKKHRLESIKKIVSGMDRETLDEIAKVYELVIEAGVHRASCIKVAEAAKVVENSQRDINIAFMNELAMVFDRMEISTKEVLDAMNTKWNALYFYPGLVGGHCIGVDPYYFIYEAEKLGYHSQIILAGRQINDGMANFIADNIIKQLILADMNVKNTNIAILGITFKEDCPDIRNTKVIDIIHRLKEFGANPIAVDPIASTSETLHEYGISLQCLSSIQNMDCVVLAVPHREFKNMDLADISRLFSDNKEKIFIDIKNIFDRKSLENEGYRVWNL